MGMKCRGYCKWGTNCNFCFSKKRPESGKRLEKETKRKSGQSNLSFGKLNSNPGQSNFGNRISGNESSCEVEQTHRLGLRSDTMENREIRFANQMQKKRLEFC